MKERVLITGAGGMLGEAVYAAVSEKYKEILATDIDLNDTRLSMLDVRDIDAVEKTFTAFRPAIVFHLAALTDLEYCERHQNDAWATNALGVENIALSAKAHDALMIYISTAGVFAGKQDEYNDFDLPKPLSYYAKTKYHGEQFVQQHLSKYFIFRAGWMMGGGLRKDKKFINKIYRQIKDGKKELFVVDDKLGTPTYTVDFAKAILKVTATNRFGLYNQVCSGHCSRLDVAREFVSHLGLENKIAVTQVSSDYFKDEYFAERPASEKLVNLKLDLRKMNHMRHWKEALKDYSAIFKNDYEKGNTGAEI